MALSLRRLFHYIKPVIKNKPKITILHGIRTANFNTMSGNKEFENSDGGISLSKIVNVLENFANPQLAEKWDNIGLLIEPSTSTPIQNIMLTNDLTEIVLDEAIKKRINLIISYHPPIFKPLTRITKETWKERIVASCLENRIAVYSPHTSWDSVTGGVTDWLADAFSAFEDGKKRVPLLPNPLEDSSCNGMGRKIFVNLPLEKCVELIKIYTRLNNIRIALGKDITINSTVKCIALVAGSGGSILKDVSADLFITGEMSHHELLDANHKGISVLLTNHSESERGFLDKVRSMLDNVLCGNANIMVSESDRDPLITV